MYVSVSPTLCLRELSVLPRREGQVWNDGVLYRSGRMALPAALRLGGVAAGSTVAIPSYICDVVPQALKEAGYQVIYYESMRTLRITVEQLSQRIPEQARVLLVVHYFGFAQENIAEIVAFAHSRGIFVVEDCAHALFAKRADTPLGAIGDAALFSLWKTLPVPDGGVLTMKGSFRLEAASAGLPGSSGLPGVFRLLLSHFCETLGCSPETVIRFWGKISKRTQEQEEFALADEQASPDSQAGASRATRKLLPRLNSARVLEGRRRNYRLWLEVLGGLGEAVFRPDLPEGACPWGLPLLLQNRDSVRSALVRRGIASCPWPRLPREVRGEEYPNAAFLASHALLLPVHQNISARKIVRAATIVRRTAEGLGISWSQ